MLPSRSPPLPSPTLPRARSVLPLPPPCPHACLRIPSRDARVSGLDSAWACAPPLRTLPRPSVPSPHAWVQNLVISLGFLFVNISDAEVRTCPCTAAWRALRQRHCSLRHRSWSCRRWWWWLW
jgi:hypothetical protein